MVSPEIVTNEHGISVKHFNYDSDWPDGRYRAEVTLLNGMLFVWFGRVEPDSQGKYDLRECSNLTLAHAAKTFVNFFFLYATFA